MSEREAKELYEELMSNNRGTKFEKLVERIINPYHAKFPGYHKVVRDIYLPSVHGGLTQVDVVMVHENGIYVLECKDTVGAVRYNPCSKLWNYSNKLSGYRMFSPVEQNRIHIRELSRYLDLDEDFFKSWIVFSSFSELHVPEMVETTIVKFNSLSTSLRKEIANSPVLFTPEEVDEITRILEKCKDISYEDRLEHLREVRGIGRYRF